MTERAIFELALSKRNKLAEKILELIAKLANNEEKEIERIKRASRWMFYRVSKDDFVSSGFDIPADKEPSGAEKALSMGLLSLDSILESINDEDLNETIEMMLIASECFGFAMGSTITHHLNNIEQTLFYRNAALKRHAENHAIKADALKYYAENIDSFRSMEDAAEKIARKIVPASVRTVRGWITQYHKKLRSAGTA
ncbi:hypothetical protein [Methylomonas koyamae]|uniref:hypothetical protein n=1 Tax=Methylomonas koyamae TaxID=702114 RepID=UPI0006D20D9B|nr:hypothetical protein [Methylomonas koyamae]BBL58821.1 hypothetical protein MKFW12EY_24340 [Methylomonas koyamae]